MHVAPSSVHGYVFIRTLVSSTTVVRVYMGFYRYGIEEEVEIHCKEIHKKKNKKARAASFYPIRGH